MIGSSFNSTTMQHHADTLNALFALHDEDAHFNKSIYTRTCKRGSAVASSADLAQNLYILVSGTVNLVCINPKGRRMVVTTLESGAVFGEGAVNNVHNNNVFAEAADNVKIWMIPASEARTMAIQYPILSWGLLQTYGERILQVEDGLEDVAYKTLPARVAALLVEISERENTCLLTKISHQKLADHLGTYRETISAILRDFKCQEIVELGYRRINILDVEALEEIGGVW